jgi:hypothetical protein
VKPELPYKNLAKHDAGDFAIHLFNETSSDEAKRALAIELLRFSEGQFVVWGDPPRSNPSKQSPDEAANAKPKGWMLPCVLEQLKWEVFPHRDQDLIAVPLYAGQ